MLGMYIIYEEHAFETYQCHLVEAVSMYESLLKIGVMDVIRQLLNLPHGMVPKLELGLE